MPRPPPPSVLSALTALLAALLLLLPAMPAQASPRNLLGRPLEICSLAPLTGFYRDGRCVTGPEDSGTHVVCAEVTKEFLEFTRSRGNDLITPRPDFRFPGLKPGDRWCLCALRWREAEHAGKAPPVVPEATNSHLVDDGRFGIAAEDVVPYYIGDEERR
ncbi:hypothetical protein DFJ74DRAFT_713944 [Hyaloraphidium curvatum]|nr:hypothetical protein DFJ74DRAFT_713944 [Hyaloraphidium curvatum]